jgi:hypothetical protein
MPDTAMLEHCSKLNDLEVLKLGAAYDRLAVLGIRKRDLNFSNADFTNQLTLHYLQYFKKLREIYFFLNGGTFTIPVEMLPRNLNKLYYGCIDRTAPLAVTLLPPKDELYDIPNIQVYRMDDHYYERGLSSM